MVALDGAIGLEEELRVLVKLRAALINRSVYCITLHSQEGIDAGERRERLFGLAAWRESPCRRISATGSGPRSTAGAGSRSVHACRPMTDHAGLCLSLSPEERSAFAFV